jgi:uroporphyrinogen decarboxylase
VRPPTTPVFEEQLQALSAIGRSLHGSMPFVETVFCPLDVAGYLTGGSGVTILREHLREHPKAVHQALQAITETFIGFVQEVLNAGASGIFFATGSWATRDTITEEEYETFGRPYDLQVLKAAMEARVNVLHVCRKNNMLRRLLDYPVQVLNWAVTEEGNPGLGEIADAVTGRAVAGGLSNEALTSPDSATAVREAEEAADQARNRGLILTGNCSIPITSSQDTIDAIHRWLL